MVWNTIEAFDPEIEVHGFTRTAHRRSRRIDISCTEYIDAV
jgi:hypothetical protein